jgi:polyhydroxybutyrate depolymerase
VPVGGVKRRALVQAPRSALATAAPVVFVFHGHGENMHIAAGQFRIHEHWPDAICVYMQGLKTATGSDPQGLELGWQNAPDVQGGRDLQFFDAMLGRLQKMSLKVDPGRIYAAGFSNGANFTYVLWATRGNVLRAVAPCAGANRYVESAMPRPCLHIGGRADTIVKYDNQERTMETVRQVNGCEPKGQVWMKGGGLRCTLHNSSRGAPFVAAIHDGGHEVPAQAGRIVVRFFQELAN